MEYHDTIDVTVAHLQAASDVSVTVHTSYICTCFNSQMENPCKSKNFLTGEEIHKFSRYYVILIERALWGEDK